MREAVGLEVRETRTTHRRYTAWACADAHSYARVGVVGGEPRYRPNQSDHDGAIGNLSAVLTPTTNRPRKARENESNYVISSVFWCTRVPFIPACSIH